MTLVAFSSWQRCSANPFLMLLPPRLPPRPPPAPPAAAAAAAAAAASLCCCCLVLLRLLLLPPFSIPHSSLLFGSSGLNLLVLSSNTPPVRSPVFFSPHQKRFHEQLVG